MLIRTAVGLERHRENEDRTRWILPRPMSGKSPCRSRDSKRLRQKQAVIHPQRRMSCGNRHANQSRTQAKHPVQQHAYREYN